MNFSRRQTTMGAMILPAELLEAEVDVPQPVLDVLEDATLTMGEKLLLLEGLFVHDSDPAPEVGRTCRRFA